MTDPVEFIDAIHKAGIRYLLIGRQAMIAHGIPVQTFDYDIYIDGEIENEKKFIEVAENFDLFPSKSSEKLHQYFMFKLENDITIDVFRAKKLVIKGGEIISFEDLYNRKETIEDKSGYAVNVPSIDDLIKLKKTADRYKDIMDVQFLEKFKAMQEGGLNE